MKAFTDRDPKKIGLVALAAAAVAVGMVFLFNKSIFRSTYTVTARFSQNAGLASGDQVLVAGVPVGEVGPITQSGDHVDVQLNLDDGTVLPRDSRASITVQTLLGVVGVDLSAGHDWSHVLQGGSRIANTQIPVEYYQLQNAAGQDFSQTDTAALNQLIRTLATVTAGKQQQVAQIIDGLSKLTTTVNDNSAQLGSLIDSAQSFSGAVAARDTQLASGLDNLNTVVSTLAADSQAVGNLIDGIDQAGSQTSQLVGTSQQKLSDLMSHLHTVLQVVNGHQLDLAQGVSYLEKAVQGFASTGYSGPGGTPNPSWTNTYVNLTGTFGLYGFIGPCGEADTALNAVLGPDPLACDKQTGPIPQYAALPLPGGSKADPRPPTASGYPSDPSSQQAEASSLAALGIDPPGSYSYSGGAALPSLFAAVIPAKGS